MGRHAGPRARERERGAWRERPIRPSRLGAGALVIAGAILIGWIAWSRRSTLPSDGGRSGAPRDSGMSEATPALRAESEAERASEDTREARETGPAPENLAPAPDSDAERERAEILASCRRAIEDALRERMDVEALLEAGLLAAQGQLDPRVVLEADGSGDLCFPVRGLPEGAEAEFRVSQGTPEHPRILSIRLAFDKPGEPAFLEQAMRERPEVTCKCFFDPEGRVERVGVLTKLDIDHRASRDALGLDVREGQLVEGMLYTTHPLDRSQDKLRVHGLAAGQPRSWDSLSSPASGYDPSRLRALGTRLLSLYQGVAPDGAEAGTGR